MLFLMWWMPDDDYGVDDDFVKMIF